MSLPSMQAVKGIVKNGRLVVNEPTELPEGEVVELVPLDEVLASGADYLDEEERARRHEAIDKTGDVEGVELESRLDGPVGSTRRAAGKHLRRDGSVFGSPRQP
jgi:hypothetical protein